MKVGQISKFSSRDKRHLFCYYQRGEQRMDGWTAVCGVLYGRVVVVVVGRPVRLTDRLTDRPTILINP